jgi:glucosamine--fructose-6-phosphate aminotransferase (isomerizing)
MKSGNFVILENNEFQILDFNGEKVKHEITKVSKEFGDAYKGDYAHFTLKEIYEQPDLILDAGERTIEGLEEAVECIRNAKNIYITGSGTSYNSALIAKQILSKYVKIKSEPIIASELQFAPETIEEGSVLIAISQSGESADVLEAVRIAKKSNCKVISIVNLLTSSLSRKGNVVLGMGCGPEIGVAATKSFTAQLIILYKIVQKLGEDITIDFEGFSKSISKMIENTLEIKKIAKELKDVSDIYILGRGINYPIAIESALKLKELTYIHAEGIPGGELKHGPLALMDTDVFVIVINPNDSTYNDTLTSAREIKARGAKIIGVSDIESDVYDHWMEIPKINEILYPISEIIPIQLLTYYSALEKDTDPDYPRNLAKSVTVK